MPTLISRSSSSSNAGRTAASPCSVDAIDHTQQNTHQQKCSPFKDRRPVPLPCVTLHPSVGVLAGLPRNILPAGEIAKDVLQPVAWISDHHSGAKANPQHRQAPAEIYDAFKVGQDDLLVGQSTWNWFWFAFSWTLHIQTGVSSVTRRWVSFNKNNLQNIFLQRENLKETNFYTDP